MKPCFSVAVVPFFAFAFVALAGCSKTDPATSPAPAADAAGKGQASGPGAIDPACTTWVDRRADDSWDPILWDPTIASAPTRCVRVKVGDSVTWTGDFAKHPIVPAKGDTPSPIAQLPANISNSGSPGEERTITTFAKAGTFGYVNPAVPTMKGSVQVVAP